MVVRKTERGFTVAEMIVTLVVVSLFMMLFFQMYQTGQSQQLHVTRQASANDIALSNLNKITSRAAYSGITGTACTSGGASVNNLADNSGAVGSVVATNATTGTTTPTWSDAGLVAESIANTTLPGAGVIQELRVFYPKGCASNMPARILSTVTYGSETVRHASEVK